VFSNCTADPIWAFGDFNETGNTVIGAVISTEGLPDPDLALCDLAGANPNTPVIVETIEIAGPAVEPLDGEVVAELSCLPTGVTPLQLCGDADGDKSIELRDPVTALRVLVGVKVDPQPFCVMP
jgi:hypothetical protein